MDCQFLPQSQCQLSRVPSPSYYNDNTYLTCCEKKSHNDRVREVIVVFLSVALFASAAYPALAHHKEKVLGAQTSATPQIPPTVEGPGLLLPDSPLFFLDQLKQNTRLLFAFTPEAKARIRADIAGERMAELRFMLAKNNKSGINTALQGVSENLQKAAEAISEAQLSGRNVFSLAKSVNEDIRRKQEALDILEAAENREISFKAKAAQAGLLEAKVRVEDALPEEELENEIEDDLHRLVEDEVETASASARRIERQLKELDEQASEAAEKALNRREEALRKAIEQKNESLLRAEERMLESEQKRQERLEKAQEKAAEQAKKAVEEAQKAAEKFREAQETTLEIKTSTE